jgi:hypothetical protein
MRHLNMGTGEWCQHDDALDVAIRCSEAGKPYVWRTSTGKEYRPREMSEGHLVNVLNLCGKRYRYRLRMKSVRLFQKSALPEYEATKEPMIAKAHHWMQVATNAASVYERVVAIPILKRMVKALQQEHGFDYTWETMRDGMPRMDNGETILLLHQRNSKHDGAWVRPQSYAGYGVDDAKRDTVAARARSLEDRLQVDAVLDDPTVRTEIRSRRSVSDIKDFHKDWDDIPF